MSDSEVRSIALFFFFALLDDKKSIEAAGQAADHCARLLKRKSVTTPSQAIVASTNHVWLRMKSHLMRGRPTLVHDLGWISLQDTNLGPWKEFQKIATEDELVTLIWSRILKVPDRDIAAALDLPEGTIRYRVGRALERMGSSVL